MTFRPHYAAGIDTQDFGHDEDPDSFGGFASYRLSPLGKGLLAVFQSLPETQRKVEYNLQFLDHQSHFTDEKPEGSYRVTNQYLSIDAFPRGIDPHVLHQKACEQINPEQYAKNMAVFEDLKQQFNTVKTTQTETLHAWRIADAKGEPKEEVDTLQAQLDSLQSDTHALHWKLSNFMRRPSMRPEHERPTMFEGFDYKEVIAKEAEMRAALYAEAVKPYAALLDSAGIVYRICSHENGKTTIEMDQQQPELAEKIATLMDTHREAIVTHYKDAKFIIQKPTGHALDKDQAAKVIAARYGELEKDAAALDSAAKQYGVERMVQALTSPRTGHGRGITGNAALDREIGEGLARRMTGD